MSTNNTAVPGIVNPYTPLAFLRPDLANKTQATCYVYVAALSAFIWDWLLSMSEEYRIIRNSRSFNVPIVAYFLSRIGTLGYCVTAVVFQVGSVADCQVLLYWIGAFSIVALPATSLLFFFRVRAVYDDSKIVTYFFSCVWLALVGGALVVPFAIFGEHLGVTRRCIMTGVRSYGSTVIIVNTTNDTLVFIAISARIISYGAVASTWRARCKSFFRGDMMIVGLSKHLLQSGQLYYFATIALSIAACTMLMAPGIPAVFQCILAIPDIALQNAMACRVFRDVKLNNIREPQFPTLSGTNVEFNVPPRSDTQFTLEQCRFGRSRDLRFSTDVAKTVDIEGHQYDEDIFVIGK